MRIYFLIIMLLSGLGTQGVAAPVAVQGRLDLSTIDWSSESIFPLNGEWRFYWNQLIAPEDLDPVAKPVTAWLPFEVEWHKMQIPGVTLSRIGYATYSLDLILAETRPLVLALPVLNSASRVWINDELKQKFGELSTTGEGEKPLIHPQRISFQGKAGLNRITIQVSNHSFWYGGPSLPARIGLPEAMRQEQLRATLVDALSFGFILFMALYHIYIFVLLKRGPGPLYFGLLSLGVSLRMAVMGDGQLLTLIWTDAPMPLRYFIEYMCVASSVGLVMSFYRSLFPAETPAWIYKPCIYVSIGWTAFVLVAPPRYYPGFLDIFQIFIALSGIATIGTVIAAQRRHRDGAPILVVTNVLFYVAVANDLVLSQRLMKTISLVHYGLMIFMVGQALILARRFGRAYDRAERAEQEVTKLNQSLEQKILERTDQINTILSHVRSGFLLVDRKVQLQNGYTSSSETILGQPLQIGASLPRQLGLPARLEMQMLLAVEQIFDAELPTEVAMQQLPARFPIKDRMIGLQAAAVKARGTDRVTAVLLTINDVTDLVAAEEGLRRADILIHILEDQDAFHIFLSDFKKDLEAAVQAIKGKDRNTLHSLLHTMKGNAASFSLDDWVQRLHEMEEKASISVQDIQDLAEHVREFLRQNEGILHLDFDQPMRTVFGVDQNDLNSLKDALIPLAPPAALARLDHWSRSVKALPLKSYTTPLGPMVKRVAWQLRKNVVLRVEGADAKVDNAFGRLLTTLPHLIRNALVHGIEDPEDRGSKPAQATISLLFQPQHDGGLHIDIRDDGRGLDRENIRAHAVEAGLIQESSVLRDEEIFALIFHPSFSTADRVSDLAGRGMGLAAVAAAVQDLGGRYEVRSEPNKGFHLMIRIPPPQQARWDRAS